MMELQIVVCSKSSIVLLLPTYIDLPIQFTVKLVPNVFVKRRYYTLFLQLYHTLEGQCMGVVL